MAAVEPESKGAPSLAEADMEPTSPAEETTPEFEEEEPSPAEGPRVAVKTEAPLAAEEGPVDQAAGEEEAKAEGRERAHGADTSSSEEKNAKKRKKQARRKAELLENQKLRAFYPGSSIKHPSKPCRRRNCSKHERDKHAARARHSCSTHFSLQRQSCYRR